VFPKTCDGLEIEETTRRHIDHGMRGYMPRLC
jgi:hypothetical protein